jgi:hypothetical protein
MTKFRGRWIDPLAARPAFCHGGAAANILGRCTQPSVASADEPSYHGKAGQGPVRRAGLLSPERGNTMNSANFALTLHRKGFFRSGRSAVYVFLLAAALSTACTARCRQGLVLQEGLCRNPPEAPTDAGDDQLVASEGGPPGPRTKARTQATSAAEAGVAEDNVKDAPMPERMDRDAGKGTAMIGSSVSAAVCGNGIREGSEPATAPIAWRSAGATTRALFRGSTVPPRPATRNVPQRKSRHVRALTGAAPTVAITRPIATALPAAAMASSRAQRRASLLAQRIRAQHPQVVTTATLVPRTC